MATLLEITGVMLGLVPSRAPAEFEGRVVRAVRAVAPPVIDGVLDDRCWQLASPATDFYMVEPNPGAPVTQPTMVFICYDDEKIYFGIHMAEDKPDKLQAAANQRDGTVYMDDSFEILIDTYCDRRNGYYFMSNLQNARLDGRIVDNGRNTDQTWDGSWMTKARLAKGGWEMEIAIPFSELSFHRSDSLVWGINFCRVERPNWESTSWAPVQRWDQVSNYGTLVGISIKPKIKRFEFLPYGAIRYEADSLKPKAGIDGEYNLTSNLVFNATVLPDFAQIESDPFQFNLSYQQGEELYFPEKRPFFLEGGAILKTPLQLFYTRRINEILAGAKLYGKIRSTEVLGLDVQAKDTEENFSVLRLKQELFRTTTIGLLATHKQHADTISQAAGVDFNQQLYGPFLLTSQFAASRNTGVTGDQWAGNLGITGETGNYGGEFFAGRIGKEFRVDQGFINAYDINRQGVSGSGWGKFIKDRGWFQWITAGGEFDVDQEIGNKLARAQTKLNLEFVTRPKVRFEVNGERSYERYGDQEFDNRTVGFEVETNVGGMTGVASIYTVGTVYDLPFQFFHFGFLFLPVQRISAFPIFQIYKSGDTRWHWLTNTRLSYQITDKAFVRVFLQAESKAGTAADQPFALEGFKNVSGNFLFGYEFAPGTILYLAYNQIRDFEPAAVNHIVVAKFSYAFRF